MSESRPPKAPKRPGARSVGAVLAQAARLHRARMGERLAELGLFAGQEQVLQALAERGATGVGDLARLLDLRPATISKTVSRLVAAGFVARGPSPGDGRATRVELTAPGLERAAALGRLRQEVEDEALRGLRRKDVKRLRRTLRAVALNLGRAADAAAEPAPADEAPDAAEE